MVNEFSKHPKQGPSDSPSWSSVTGGNGQDLNYGYSWIFDGKDVWILNIDASNKSKCIMGFPNKTPQKKVGVIFWGEKGMV